MLVCPSFRLAARHLRLGRSVESELHSDRPISETVLDFAVFDQPRALDMWGRLFEICLCAVELRAL